MADNGDISFTYNGYTPEQTLDSYSVTEAYESLTFAMGFLLTVADPDDLEAEVEAALSALRAWDKDLVISRGATDTTYSQSSNTGMLGRPSASKSGTPLDTGRSQRLDFTVTMQRPASDSGFNGRRDSRFSISREGPSGKVIVAINARYTATAVPKAAREGVLEFFQTYADSVMTSIANDMGFTTYEQIQDPTVEHDGEDKSATCSVQYQEVLADETGSGQDVDLRAVNYSFTADPQPLGHRVLNPRGPSKGDSPPIEFSTSYTTIVKASKTGALVDSLKKQYITKIESFLQAEIKEQCGITTGTVIVEARTVTLSETARTITVAWRGVILGAKMIRSYDETFQLMTDDGVVFDHFRTGKQDDLDAWSIGRTLTASRTVTITTYNTPADIPPEVSGWLRLGAGETFGPYGSVGLDEAGSSNRRITYTSVRYSKSFTSRYVFIGGRGPGRGGGSETTGGPIRNRRGQ